jgi:hypothetical protein
MEDDEEEEAQNESSVIEQIDTTAANRYQQSLPINFQQGEKK